MNRNSKKDVWCVGIAVGIGFTLGLALSASRKPPAGAGKSAQSIPVREPDNLLDNMAPPKEMTLEENTSGVFFGRSFDDQPGYIGKPANEDGHILVVGSSGSGKTSAIADPTALTWKGSVIRLMIKGNYEEYVQQRKEEGRPVLVFDPAAGEENQIRYNVFSAMDHHPEDRIDYARAIAEALVPLSEGTREPIWIQAVQAYLTGSVLFFYSLGYEFPEMMREIQYRNVIEIAELIMGSGNMDAIMFISKLSSADIKLLQSTGFELNALAQFISPHMLAALGKQDGCGTLDWELFNQSESPADVVLVIPEAKLDQWKSMLTLMIDQMIRSLMNRPERTYGDNELPPLLIILDEFPRLGEVPSILNGLMTLRSRGVTFLLLIQSLSSLEAIYGEKAARVIMENCCYKVVLRVSEPSGQQYFSDLIGSTATVEMSTNQNISAGISIFASVNLGSSVGEARAPGRKPIVFPYVFLTMQTVICITPYGVCQVRKSPCYLQ